MHRIFGLDALRAIAILWVLALHSLDFFRGQPAPAIWAFGWAGVDLFFVLSGFLIGGQALAVQAHSAATIREFWLKRWFRTLPLYFLLLGVYVALKPLAGYPFNGSALPFFVFLQNFFSPKDFVQSWSLCIEEQFYLALPLVLWIGRRYARTWQFWGGLALLSFGARFAAFSLAPPLSVADAAYRFQFPTLLHLDGIALGVALAASRPQWQRWGTGAHRALALAGLSLVAVAMLFGDPALLGASAVWLFGAFSLGFAALLPAALRWERPRWAMPVERIALLSYGIYLWNNLVFRFAERLPLPPVAQLLAGWTACFLLAALTYRVVEKPALRLRDRYLAAPRSRRFSILARLRPALGASKPRDQAAFAAETAAAPTEAPPLANSPAPPPPAFH